jgi:hypothetical protein
VSDAAPKSDAAPADTESKPDAAKADVGKEGEAKADLKETPSLLDDEAKDDEGKTPDKADGKADAKKDGEPEQYAAFDVPDGMTLDDGLLAQATPVFRELNLDQGQAQKLVSLYADAAKNTVAGLAQQQNAARETLIADWTAKTKTAFGDKLAEAKGHVNAAINSLPAPEAAELRQMFRETRISNHPLLFKLLDAYGATLSEDKLMNGDAGAQARAKSTAERLYPNMPGDNQ